MVQEIDILMRKVFALRFGIKIKILLYMQNGFLINIRYLLIGEMVVVIRVI